MSHLRRNAPSQSGRQRLFDGEKVAPGKPLLQWLTQQIGRVQRGQGADLARSGTKVEPAAACFQNTVLDAEQRLRRRAAKTDQNIRIGELDLPQDERQTNLR